MVSALWVPDMALPRRCICMYTKKLRLDARREGERVLCDSDHAHVGLNQRYRITPIPLPQTNTQNTPPPITHTHTCPKRWCERFEQSSSKQRRENFVPTRFAWPPARGGFLIRFFFFEDFAANEQTRVERRKRGERPSTQKEVCYLEVLLPRCRLAASTVTARRTRQRIARADGGSGRDHRVRCAQAST